MKIKHFAGYGSVNASVVMKKLNTLEKSKTFVVKVWGNHEYGLDRSRYKEDVALWLNKVIKDSDLKAGLEKTGPDGYNFCCNLQVSYEQLPYARIDNCDVEQAQYTIKFNYQR